ncbi:cell division control protein 14, SIN component-domain-containing protein [Lentinula raphanica]|uniref:Cell division control protein 14, SIN component-domain-containing protein n=1 Tax=Lentinula raphanica TaxID=153919 RepID=A0AA38PFA2_9AGAR|nr:cell division control protein 14, SIN component-domain-containing protein [Lentinula raphanica]KAJ3841867.1 cell division control protein 14, SIN component-domain-containing protein [Lentinula raphanica]KAJ3970314.1 cell division control protein 14, SIN component-domain-containing protein [Lentinula raphanica]
MALERLKNDTRRIYVLKEDIENDLDEITSPRTTGTVRTAILKRLEVLVGSACLKSSGSQVELDELMQLQDSFECNIPSKLLPWIFSSSLRLETLATSCKNSGGESESSKNDQLTELTTQLILALSIIQGVALNHQRSKRWLGKTKSLEILVDLLLASRHVPSSIFDTAASTSSPKKNALPPSLTSTILDTMLCILVDSTLALRSFEQCNGVQAIVKILKRAGSPREVRMKCLEFLYFYLLDETKPSVSAASSSLSTLVNPQTPIQPRTATTSSQSSIFPPTVPNTPATRTHSRQNSQSILRAASNSSISSASSMSSTVSSKPASIGRSQTRKPYLNGLAAPNRPSPKPRSEYGSSTFSFPHSSYSGPSIGSEGRSDKGYITESSPSSRSNSDSAKTGMGHQVAVDGEANTFRSVSSGSAKSFTSTSSTTSANSVNSSRSNASSTTTAPGSVECSPKKTSSALPMLPTIPSGMVFRTPPGSPEIEFAAPPGLVSRSGREPPMTPAPRTSAVFGGSSSRPPSGAFKTPASKASHRVPRSEGKQLFPSTATGGQTTSSYMMLQKDVDYVPQSPQKVHGSRRESVNNNINLGSAAPSPGVGVGTGSVAGIAGGRTRTHSRTRSAFALGAMSTRVSSRGSSRERGHSRARSVGRSESEPGPQESRQLSSMEGRNTDAAVGMEQPPYRKTMEPSRGAVRMEVRARTTEEKKELLGTMLGNVDALVEGVRKAGIWGLG